MTDRYNHVVSAEHFFYNISQLVTPIGKGAKRGEAMKKVQCLEQTAFAVSDGKIVWLGLEKDWQGKAYEEHNLNGRAVVPGLIDPHTHAFWAGDRFNDFEARTSGVSYETILREGGGIRSTVRHTQGASLEQLIQLALPRLNALIQSGATTIEIKSGYGFTPEAELKMLEAIQEVQQYVPARLVPTLLIHIPPQNKDERESYLRQICHSLIPEVAKRNLAKAVDVFIEKEAFSTSEAEQIFQAAKKHQLPVKAHADQFHAVGGTELTCSYEGLSVDHLEASGEAQIKALAKSQTIATLLPGVTLHLGLPAAPGRKLIDAGAAVAIGTDLNPGSSPLFSTQQALALSIRLNGLTPSEALTACTVNPASALGLEDCGRLGLGCRADFLVLQDKDWRVLPYTLGANPVAEVWMKGERYRG
jgi:imidazolonepropionase